MTVETSTKVALLTALIAALALVGTIINWIYTGQIESATLQAEMRGADTWMQNMLKERGERLRNLERRVGILEKRVRDETKVAK